ncbi:MAG: sigma-70 family RNA polymerase sigma factor [Thermoanaerobaculia bacterium]|nr:sigma-70 family RNA polymerase sigma factor [Thermoanaerobaculia bacterium]
MSEDGISASSLGLSNVEPSGAAVSSAAPESGSLDVTRLLIAYRRGEDEALECLLPLIYDDLRLIARQQLARLRPGNTLDTTALVHEAYLKLIDQARVEPTDIHHFFALSANAMRQILVDHVRRRTAKKRGGGAKVISLDRIQIGVDEQADTVLALDEALGGLTQRNPRLTRVFECRFFAGMSEKETARALGISARTVQRDWVMSRAWLRRALRESASPGPDAVSS